MEIANLKDTDDEMNKEIDPLKPSDFVDVEHASSSKQTNILETLQTAYNSCTDSKSTDNKTNCSVNQTSEIFEIDYEDTGNEIRLVDSDDSTKSSDKMSDDARNDETSKEPILLSHLLDGIENAKETGEITLNNLLSKETFDPLLFSNEDISAGNIEHKSRSRKVMKLTVNKMRKSITNQVNDVHENRKKIESEPENEHEKQNCEDRIQNESGEKRKFDINEKIIGSMNKKQKYQEVLRNIEEVIDNPKQELDLNDKSIGNISVQHTNHLGKEKKKASSEKNIRSEKEKNAVPIDKQANDISQATENKVIIKKINTVNTEKCKEMVKKKILDIPKPRVNLNLEGPELELSCSSTLSTSTKFMNKLPEITKVISSNNAEMIMPSSSSDSDLEEVNVKRSLRPRAKSVCYATDDLQHKIDKPVESKDALCTRCHRAMKISIRCELCKEVFHSGCIAVANKQNQNKPLSSDVCIHKYPLTSDTYEIKHRGDSHLMRGKSQSPQLKEHNEHSDKQKLPQQIFPQCFNCNRKAVSFRKCVLCNLCFHYACWPKAIKRFGNGKHTCMHRTATDLQSSADEAEEVCCGICGLTQNLDLACQSCDGYFHKNCFEKRTTQTSHVVSSGQCEHKELARKQINKIKTKMMTKLKCLALKKVFDCALLKKLPLRNVNAYIQVFKEFNISILKYPAYQQKASVIVLTTFINDWPKWTEIRRQYNIYVELKKKFKGSCDKGSDMADYFNNFSVKRIVWVNEFYAYLSQKLNNMLKLLKVEKEEPKLLNHRAIGEVDYCLNIEGRPSDLNCIIFTLDNDKVKLRNHEILPFVMDNITCKKLINYPYINVHFKLADIDIKRSNCHEYDRYVMAKGVSVETSPPEQICSITKISEEEPVQVYTYLYFLKYFAQLDKLINDAKEICEFRRKEMKVIYQELLSDIDELLFKQKSLATNTSICFSIGLNKYIRSKQLSMHDMNFWEIISPRVNISLNSFIPQQELLDETNVSFMTLNEYEADMATFAKEVLECITYECNMCKKDFVTFLEISTHCKTYHGAEHPVICWRCGESVEVNDLADLRWKHNCNE